MGYKTIRMVGFLATLMGCMFVLIRGAETVGLISGSTNMALPVGFAFLFMGQLARATGSILEAQADEIAHLRLQVSEGRREA